LTAGFVGKFYVLVAGVESALWLLIFLLVFGQRRRAVLLLAHRGGHAWLPSRGYGHPRHDARTVAVVRPNLDAHWAHPWSGMAGLLSCAIDPHHPADGGQPLVRRSKAIPAHSTLPEGQHLSPDAEGISMIVISSVKFRDAPLGVSIVPYPRIRLVLDCFKDPTDDLCQARSGSALPAGACRP
jgi:hypothetical protein